MLNKVIIRGRIGQEPQYAEASNGVQYCTFSIACERDYKKQNAESRETDWFDCIAWRSNADFVSKYFHKGTACEIVGRLVRESYIDKNDNKRYSVKIQVESIYFAESKKAAQENNGNEEYKVPEVAPGAFVELEEDDSDLPF